MSAVLDVVGAVLVLAGALLALTAAIGLLRLPDTLSRMHAATKPQTLGLVLVALGAALRLRDGPDVWMLVLAAVFQLVTAPVTAHLVSRRAVGRGGLRADLLHVDERTAAEPPAEPPAGPPGAGPDPGRPGPDPAPRLDSTR